MGDPGNVADTAVMTGPNGGDGTTGYGSVGNTYRMGTYDVTVGQYVQFLNAVASTDTYGLYNWDMSLGPSSGNQHPTIGITQSGNSGSYTYSVAGSDPAAANCPIFNVSWGDAARLCNWLQTASPQTWARLPARPKREHIR